MGPLTLEVGVFLTLLEHFPPIGLPCLSLTSGFVTLLIASCYAVFV